jgi:uncharacterized protein with FMN-binding domain
MESLHIRNTPEQGCRILGRREQNVAMRVYPTHVAFGCLGAVGLIGALSGCAATTSDQSYRDGEYSADGTYSAPSGTETIGVDITLENDIVVAVDVTPHATEGTQKKFQLEFVDGIAAEVLGKDIDQLSVTRVSGSSLTSGGFNEALQAIKKQAAGS